MNRRHLQRWIRWHVQRLKFILELHDHVRGIDRESAYISIPAECHLVTVGHAEQRFDAGLVALLLHRARPTYGCKLLQRHVDECVGVDRTAILLVAQLEQNALSLDHRWHANAKHLLCDDAHQSAE